MESEELQDDVQPVETKIDINPKRLADEAYSDYRTRRAQVRKDLKKYFKGKLSHISTYLLPGHGKITVNPPYKKENN
jgi:hypothetical protein